MAGEEEQEAAAEAAEAFLSEELPEAVFGSPKAGAGMWASCLRIMHPTEVRGEGGTDTWTNRQTDRKTETKRQRERRTDNNNNKSNTQIAAIAFHTPTIMGGTAYI